jgi:hypothetical protein
MQARALAIPRQHVPYEGGARNHPKDLYSLGLQHTIREAVSFDVSADCQSDLLNGYGS